MFRYLCVNILGARYLPEILVRMRTEHPGIALQVHEGDTETLTRQLECGALDVALMYGGRDPAQHAGTHLC